MIYSSYVRSMDMKTMCINMSSPESIIMKVGMSQMGDYVGLPTKMPANLRDGKVLDAQAGFETGMGGLAGALSCDFIVSMQLDMDLMVDFADMIYSCLLYTSTLSVNQRQDLTGISLATQ